MKKIYSIISLAAAVILAASCDMEVKNFLDVKPRGKEIATKLDHYIGQLNHTSNISISGNLVYPNMGEELMNYPSPLERLQTQQKDPGLFAFQYKTDVFDGEVASTEWSNTYAKIYQYNTVINGVMNAIDGTEDQKREIQAEARVQRAYLHFFASIFFAKPYNKATADTDLSVPIVTVANTQAYDGYKRATTKELYDWVISEITDAIKYLPTVEGAHLTRCYKDVAEILLGRVYWYMGDYDNALTHLRAGYSVINADKKTYSFLSYRDNNTKWKGAKTFYNSYPQPWQSNTEMVSLRYISMTDLVNESNPILFIKPEYVSMYKDGDLRINLLTKHAATGGMRPAGRQYFNTMVELPELYFMLAECEARAGSEDAARGLMLTYRKSRFASDEAAAIPAEVAGKDDLIKFIVNERILEYPARGASVIDMKRLWNDPLFQFKKAAYTHPVEGGETYKMDEAAQLTWKIPYSVLKFHPDWK